MKDVIGIMFGVVVTPWKLVGFLGALMFAGRWVVQAWATRAPGKPDDPAQLLDDQSRRQRLVTSYFIWGKNDSVGVLTNLLPASVALYNLVMDIKSGAAGFQCLISACFRACRRGGAPRLRPFRPNLRATRSHVEFAAVPARDHGPGSYMPAACGGVRLCSAGAGAGRRAAAARHAARQSLHAPRRRRFARAICCGWRSRWSSSSARASASRSLARG